MNIDCIKIIAKTHIKMTSHHSVAGGCHAVQLCGPRVETLKCVGVELLGFGEKPTKIGGCVVACCLQPIGDPLPSVAQLLGGSLRKRGRCEEGRERIVIREKCSRRSARRSQFVEMRAHVCACGFLSVCR